MKAPPKWTEQELEKNAEKSANLFRNQRLAPTEEWKAHVDRSRELFNVLFKQLGGLAPDKVSDATLAKAFGAKLGEALRYLAGPPISDDDLRVLADVPSLAPGVLSADPAKARQVFKVIEQTIDPFRFPWVVAKRAPTKKEREAALLASSVLLAAQRMSTARRSVGKEEQEAEVTRYLTSLKYKEVPRTTIKTIVQGPKEREFCGESMLGNRKADVIVRLADTRLMPIECKVSNSATNSVKRLNNDAAVKAVDWIKTFGTDQVVPTAVISGVFKVSNLIQAQKMGLTIFWAHDLEKLGEFLSASTSTA